MQSLICFFLFFCAGIDLIDILVPPHVLSVIYENCPRGIYRRRIRAGSSSTPEARVSKRSSLSLSQNVNV